MHTWALLYADIHIYIYIYIYSTDIYIYIYMLYADIYIYIYIYVVTCSIRGGVHCSISQGLLGVDWLTGLAKDSGCCGVPE